jgi:hypothetical protein
MDPDQLRNKPKHKKRERELFHPLTTPGLGPRESAGWPDPAPRISDEYRSIIMLRLFDHRQMRERDSASLPWA